MANADQIIQSISADQKGIPKSKRKLQKHLRSAGLAYVSRTGKIIPAKKVADELCQCPHKCDELVPWEERQNLFQHFYGLGEADLQNQFLRSNMDLRARLNVPETTGSGRPPRRITCKYLVPLMDEGRSVEVCQKAFVSAFVITTKRVRLQREKLISSLGLNSYRSHNRSKKAENNNKTKPNTSIEANNNNNNIMLNNNTITLNSLKSKFNLPSNLSLYLPSACQISVSNIKSENTTSVPKIKTENSVSLSNIKTENTSSASNIKSEYPLSASKIKSEYPLSASKIKSEYPINLSNIKTENTASESNSAKKLASILGKKSMEELRELNISMEQNASTSDSESDVKPPPLKKIKLSKKRREQALLDNPFLPFGLVVPDGVTIAPVMGPDHDRDIAIVNNFFHNQLWKPEYIGALS